MSKASDIAAKLEAIKAQRLEQSQRLKPIFDQTRAREADRERRLEDVGEVGVSCTHICHGPKAEARGLINHQSIGLADISRYGVTIEGAKEPYLAHRCTLDNRNKLCVATDEKLRQAVGKAGKETG